MTHWVQCGLLCGISLGVFKQPHHLLVNWHFSHCRVTPTSDIVHNAYACVPPFTRKTYIDALKLSDAIWWQRSELTLAQVMACCQTAPSHYLNQYQLIVNMALVSFIRQQFQTKCSRWQYLRGIWNHILTFLSHLPGANELTKINWD